MKSESPDYNQYLSASQCSDFGRDCFGPVEFHSIGDGINAFPRCTRHFAMRLKQYSETFD